MDECRRLCLSNSKCKYALTKKGHCQNCSLNPFPSKAADTVMHPKKSATPANYSDKCKVSKTCGSMAATCDSSHGVAKAATTKCNTCAKNGDECCTAHRCDDKCKEWAGQHGWKYV